ncbi:predicted protein [Uncinocarpus reesii 1704]|uniref:Uncharacterized protein n=1 Tax=Uncinocarpus reesii (strain UAMH 1704) TaxID=336963 RepID=C4JF97_UNCRE|nr:uncharacterized protein UREG_02319 [Uncinocarpus reesii 1704]EEP77470.1 predicted protein [Uncinocarpus reesii 1704]
MTKQSHAGYGWRECPLTSVPQPSSSTTASDKAPVISTAGCQHTRFPLKTGELHSLARPFLTPQFQSFFPLQLRSYGESQLPANERLNLQLGRLTHYAFDAVLSTLPSILFVSLVRDRMGSRETSPSHQQLDRAAVFC